jgi:membrane protease YdiL (CAAX protease family)
VHAVALAFLMLGVAVLCSKILPHRETDLERILKLGTSVRALTALLAVLTAPLVEEVVYRGVLYPGIARRAGWVTGVVVTTLLFALVHVPQYWGSWAAISTIVMLSFLLTMLRAATGSVLPSFATHLVYNGIQAITLLFGLDDSLKKQTTETAWALWTQWLGCG